VFTEDEIITGKCCSVSVCVLDVIMFDCCTKSGTSYTRNSIDKGMGTMASVMRCWLLQDHQFEYPGQNFSQSPIGNMLN